MGAAAKARGDRRAWSRERAAVGFKAAFTALLRISRLTRLADASSSAMAHRLDPDACPPADPLPPPVSILRPRPASAATGGILNAFAAPWRLAQWVACRHVPAGTRFAVRRAWMSCNASGQSPPATRSRLLLATDQILSALPLW